MRNCDNNYYNYATDFRYVPYFSVNVELLILGCVCDMRLLAFFGPTAWILYINDVFR